MEGDKEAAMQLGLENRIALVGGASRGLGYACARALAAEGADVVICSRSRTDIERAADRIAQETGRTVVPVAADQSASRDLERFVASAVERFGRIDILVTNTGGPPPGGALDHDDATWVQAFEGLVLSVIRLTRLVTPHMAANRWGRIIHNTSFTVKEPAERLVLSNALRTAVVSFAKTLAREVASMGITVNSVCPGAFDTERLRRLFQEQAERHGETIDAVRTSWESSIPLGRLQEPEELAALVAFLASDLAAAITGGCFPIDGGMLHGVF